MQTKKKRPSLFASLAAGALFALVALQTGYAKEKQTHLADLEAEQQESEDNDAAALRSVLSDTTRSLAAFSGFELLTTPDLQLYAKSIADRLAAEYRGPAPDPAISVEIVAAPGGGASASFDNTIYVSADLFSNAENEDEIAFVLAHEVAHILSEDFKDDGFLEAKKNAADSGARAAMAGAALASTDVRAENGAVSASQDETAVSKAARTASLSYFVVAELADTVIAPSWTNRQEDVADLVAVDLMMRAGYNPTAAGPLFQRMVEKKQSASERFENLTKSWSERAKERLGSVVSVNGYNVTFNSEEALKTFKTMSKELLIAGVFSMREARRGASHDDAEERETAITDYVIEHYAAQLGQLSLSPVRNKQSANALGARVDAARNVRLALLVDDLAKAKTSSGGLLSGSTSRDAFFRYTMYQLRYAEYMEDRSPASRGKAVLNLERSKSSPTATPQIFTALALERSADGETDQALGVLDEAAARYDMEPPFWPVKITALVKGGRMDQAQSLLDQCQADGGRRIRSMCRTAFESAEEAELRKMASEDDKLEDDEDIDRKSRDFAPGQTLRGLFGGNKDEEG